MRNLLVLLVLMTVRVACADESPFKIRGIKGLWWEGLPKYRMAMPWVAEHHMNFLMLCYSSFPASGKDWRADYSSEELNGFEQLAAQGRSLGVELCLSFNPGIWSKPPLVHGSEEDFACAFRKVKAVHARGVHSFAICLDDISRKLEPADAQRFGSLQNAQVYFINRLWRQMKTLDPRPRLIFCPSAYTTHDAAQHRDYIETIGRQIDPEVMMFWTGPVVCSPTITRQDAEQFGAWIKRKPLVWDNYPVNDMFPWRPLLAPVKGRAKDLGGAVEGLMANPMKQWHASKIPLATLSRYFTDPVNYDPAQAMEDSVNEFPQNERDAVRALVSVYGSSFLGEKDYPPGKSKSAQTYQELEKKLTAQTGLKDLWEDVKPTLQDDSRKSKP